MLLVVSLLLVVRPGAPSSVLVTTSKALVTRSDALVTSSAPARLGLMERKPFGCQASFELDVASSEARSGSRIDRRW